MMGPIRCIIFIIVILCAMYCLAIQVSLLDEALGSHGFL